MELEQCLAILAERGICEHGRHAPPPPGEVEPPLGQVIDLLPPTPPSPDDDNNAGAGNSSSTNGKKSGDEEQAPLSTEARALLSVAKLQEGLAGLDVQGLVGVFRQAQEERAQAYQRFDEGLNKVLASMVYAEYDGLCAEATAGFAALSNLVNAVAQCLATSPHDRKVVAGLLRRVQIEEKEKLALTAALHLERFRLATAKLSLSSGCSGGESAGVEGKEEDGREEKLLQEGVKTLEVRIGEVKVRINDMLEELRYEVEEE